MRQNTAHLRIIAPSPQCLQCAAYALGAVRLPIASGRLVHCSIILNATAKAASQYGRPIANGRHTRRFRRMQSEDGSVTAHYPYDNAIPNASKMSNGSASMHQQRPAQHRRAHTHTHTPRHTGTHRQTHTQAHTGAPEQAHESCSVDNCYTMQRMFLTSGLVPQWKTHRPTEAGIAGSSSAGVTLLLPASVPPAMGKTLKAHNTNLMETHWPHAGLNRGPYGYWPFALTSRAVRPLSSQRRLHTSVSQS